MEVELFSDLSKKGEGERIYILFGTEGNGGRGEERGRFIKCTHI
jgi:hypothetical protein